MSAAAVLAVVSVAVTVAGASPAGAATPADVSVTLSRSPNIGQALVDPVTFTAVVTNGGPEAAPNVVLVNPLSPLGAIIDDVTTTRGTCDEERTQVTCELGTLASGASATVTIVLRISRSGLVTNTVAVTSAADDPDAENNIASAAVVLTEPPSFEEIVVIGYFDLVLGLEATDEQVERWIEELYEYGYYGPEFTLLLLKTYTFRRNWVDASYQKLLDRPADPTGLATFTRQLSQRATYEQVTATIAGSSEYYSKAGGTPETFVDRLVRDLTGHAPPADFADELLGRLDEGQSRTRVAYRVATSGLGRLAWLKWQYRRYYGREANRFELSNGLFALSNGTRPAWLLAQLLGDFEIIERFLPDYYWEYGVGSKGEKTAV